MCSIYFDIDQIHIWWAIGGSYSWYCSILINELCTVCCFYYGNCVSYVKRVELNETTKEGNERTLARSLSLYSFDVIAVLEKEITQK